MKASTGLRTCLILEWGFLIAGVFLSFAMESHLPPRLQAWLQTEAIQGRADYPMLFFSGLLLVTMIVATVGLLKLRRWGAWLYLIGNAFGTGLTFLKGPTVDHALPKAVVEVALILSGVVIGIAFFTDVLKNEPDKAIIRDGS